MRTRTVIGLCAGFVGMVLSAHTASAQDKAVIERGMKVYAAQKCGVCHSIEGKGAKKGPLDGGRSSKLTAEEIRQWIVNAPEMTKKPKPTRKPLMKNYANLPKDDVDALVAYMGTLKKELIARPCRCFDRPAIVRHPLSLLGAALTTVTAVLFLVLLLLDFLGYFRNPYVGLLLFVAVPAAFVAGSAADSRRRAAGVRAAGGFPRRAASPAGRFWTSASPASGGSSRSWWR